MNIKDFTVDQTVFCYSFGSWYEGKVAKLGRTKLHVTYTTGSGKTRTKAFSLDLILIAAAVVLGIAYFTVRNNRKQAEVKRHMR